MAIPTVLYWLFQIPVANLQVHCIIINVDELCLHKDVIMSQYMKNRYLIILQSTQTGQKLQTPVIQQQQSF